MLDISTRSIDQFPFGDLRILSRAGRGNFSVYVVRLASDPDKKVMALKLAKLDPSPLNGSSRGLFREFKILRSLQHPNIIKVFRGFNNGLCFSFLMEYCPYGSLEAYIKHGDLDIVSLKKLTRQIGSALEYLHSKSIAHYDVKAANVLITPSFDFKLTDFDNASDALVEQHGIRGTFAYLAPEIMMGKAYNMSVDIWAFGVLLYFAAYHSLPFPEIDNALNMLKAVCKRNVSFPGTMPLQFEYLLQRMLEINPELRLTWNEFRAVKFYS
ncbi:CAMK/CAMKL/MARK protein kinase [Schizosaccharomyces japonicus yFS275]|uniref:non-specific serine/threonine protein kinase n=1 Tax=Schizosaccharomyces japonicus (strain yFS275 / FY16936) TaxID=402676 RepID=B6JUR6_SCHJY|nr:CAMK/CAMKL/MARK protein kinase [Schizosaccharomyces japonicus yFS275]EEB05020.1 CAMK/CAMKL/MARK protein kinase [Schizosaccharomyces japonicus yFS275]